MKFSLLFKYLNSKKQIYENIINKENKCKKIKIEVTTKKIERSKILAFLFLILKKRSIDARAKKINSEYTRCS